MEQHFRVIYYKVLDLCKSCITDRFEQRGMTAHVSLENLILKASQSESYSIELEKVKSIYSDDLNGDQLQTELNMLQASGKCFGKISEFFAMKKIENLQQLFPQLARVAKLLLLMPASNAASERSFSAMNRVKSCMRASMGQSRLNSLMMLHVHNHLADKIDFQEIIKQFVSCHPRRSFYL